MLLKPWEPPAKQKPPHQGGAQSWKLLGLVKGFVYLSSLWPRETTGDCFTFFFFFFKEKFPLWKWHVFIFRNPATGIYNFCGKEAAQGPMLTLLY